MFRTIKGYYENGKIILNEMPLIEDKTEVLVTFLTEEIKTEKPLKRKLGGLEGKVNLPSNFNEINVFY